PDRVSRRGAVRPNGRVCVFAAGGHARHAIPGRCPGRGETRPARGDHRSAARDLERTTGALCGTRCRRARGPAGGGSRDQGGARAMAGGRCRRGHLPRAGRLDTAWWVRASPNYGERGLRLPGGCADVTRSGELFDRAKRVLPGGVNSPVRAPGAARGTPVVVARGRRASRADVAGPEYLDSLWSAGAVILGSGHPSRL